MRDVTATIIDLAVRGYPAHRADRRPGGARARPRLAPGADRQDRHGPAGLRAPAAVRAVRRPVRRDAVRPAHDVRVLARPRAVAAVRGRHGAGLVLRQPAVGARPGGWRRASRWRWWAWGSRGAGGHARTGAWWACRWCWWACWCAAVSRAAPSRTPAGTAVLAQTEGFRRYLATAEADQLRFEEGEDLFSRYLPFAVAFGLTERWTRIFAELAARGVDLPVPTWYVGGWGYARVLGRRERVRARPQRVHDARWTPRSPRPRRGRAAARASPSGGGFSGGGVGGGGGGSW